LAIRDKWIEEAMRVPPRLVFRLIVVAACATAPSCAAWAVDNTRYVSITGNDANACMLAAPCLTLQRGIDATPEGGELRVLDSGVSANSALIDKSITISGNGNTVYLGIPAVRIDHASAVVTVRDLTLNGQGTSSNGISIDVAAAVHIVRCVIHGFTRNGISASGPDAGKVFVRDSTSRDNGSFGLLSRASRLTVDNSRFDNNGLDGIYVDNGLATIGRSSASGNARHGLDVLTGSLGAPSVSVVSTMAARNGENGFLVASGGATMAVESSVAHGNGNFGLAVFVGGIARISNSTFTSNAIGIAAFGVIETRQNNTVGGNGFDVDPTTLTVIAGV
jgi:hypothetical protein